MYGVVLLENTPQAITREQALKLQVLMGGKDPASHLGDYMIGQVSEILEAPQKSFLESKLPLRSLADTAHRKAMLEKIEGLAGAKATELITQPGQAARHGRSAHYLEILAAYHEEMATQPGLALTPDQARKLLPYVNTFVNVPTTLEGIMLATLTDDQKKGIDLALSQPRTRPDQAEIGNQFSRIIAERTR